MVPQSASQPFRACPCLSAPPQLSELLTFAPTHHLLVPTPGAVAPRGATAMSLRSLCRSGLSRGLCPSPPSPGTPILPNFSLPVLPSFFFPSLFCRSSPLCTVRYVRCGSTVPEKTHTTAHAHTRMHTHMQSQTHSWAPAARKDRGLEINEGERRKGERSLNKLALEKRRKMRRRD